MIKKQTGKIIGFSRLKTTFDNDLRELLDRGRAFERRLSRHGFSIYLRNQQLLVRCNLQHCEETGMPEDLYLSKKYY